MRVRTLGVPPVTLPLSHAPPESVLAESTPIPKSLPMSRYWTTGPDPCATAKVNELAPAVVVIRLAGFEDPACVGAGGGIACTGVTLDTPPLAPCVGLDR